MVRTDEDAVICDLAETYGIYDYRSLPLHTAATLCVGLRNDSRIKLKLSGQHYPEGTILAACAVDELRILRWLQTTDAAAGRNRPESLLAKLLGDHEEERSDIASFGSPEDFESRRRSIIEGIRNG